MTLWSYLWAIVVFFSLISFTYMSGKILIKSIAELKGMFQMLGEKQGEN